MGSITKQPKKSSSSIIQYNSPVILTFAFLSLGVLMLGTATQNQTTIDFFSVYYTSWTDPLMFIRLFTHVLGHANFEHYFGNFMMILLVGPMIEEKYGSQRLLILMVITALITGALSITLFPDIILCGASGIVFALIILSSYANFEKGKIPLTLVLVAFAYIGREVVAGMTVEDNISNLAHIIGGAVGGVIGYWISGENKEMKKARGASLKTPGVITKTDVIRKDI